jgi:ubiquinone/menaquinone biosynthesis C-methylase UbiE
MLLRVAARGTVLSMKDTSWEKVASWYDAHLEEDADTYQAKVILPNLTRMLELSGKERLLDIACGQGFFTRSFAKAAKHIEGCDLSASLIAYAKAHSADIPFTVCDAAKLSFAKDASFDVAYCVLALQNVEKADLAVKEAARVLAKGGRFVFVLNHPAFRIPKSSSWGFDAKENVQYRRVDRYLTPSKEKIDMTPGKRSDKEYTVSFHRSLQDYMKLLRAAGLAAVRMEEWISHKKSGAGPRRKAEDIARKEFPLFLAVEAKKLS